MNESRLKGLPGQVTGWFAVEYSNALQPNQKKQIIIAGKLCCLSRSTQGDLMLNGQSSNILEQNDIIYVWYEKQGCQPKWYIPQLNPIGWTRLSHHQFQVQSHLQEIYENSIDVAHFKNVHGFKHLALAGAPTFNQHVMIVNHAIQRKNIFLLKKNLTAYFELQLYGLGCAYTHIEVPALKLFVRMITMATIKTLNTIDIRLAIAVRINKNKRLKFFQFLLQRLIFKNIISDFYQDLPIWNNKRYVQKPLLVKGDGRIIQFRRWCQQFY